MHNPPRPILTAFPPRQEPYGAVFYGAPWCSPVFLAGLRSTGRRDVASPPGIAREQAAYLRAAYGGKT